MTAKPLRQRFDGRPVRPGKTFGRSFLPRQPHDRSGVRAGLSVTRTASGTCQREYVLRVLRRSRRITVAPARVDLVHVRQLPIVDATDTHARRSRFLPAVRAWRCRAAPRRAPGCPSPTASSQENRHARAAARASRACGRAPEWKRESCNATTIASARSSARVRSEGRPTFNRRTPTAACARRASIPRLR